MSTIYKHIVTVVKSAAKEKTPGIRAYNRKTYPTLKEGLPGKVTFNFRPKGRV